MKCNHCYRHISKKDMICPYCGKEVIDNRKSKWKQNIILIVLLLLLIFQPRNILRMNRGPGLPDNKINYQSMTFEHIISNNLDKDSTVTLLFSKEKSLKEILNNNNYKIDSSTQSVYESNNSLRAMTYIRTIKHDIYYNVSVVYEKGKLVETKLDIEGYKDRMNSFHIGEDKINTICKEIQIDNAYNILSEGHSLMKQNQLTEAYEYESDNKYEVFLKEIIEDDRIKYKYTIKYKVE